MPIIYSTRARNVALGLLALLAFVVAVVPRAASADARPTISVAPKVVTAGETFVVRGARWQKSTAVTVMACEDVDGGTCRKVAITRTDRRGRFSAVHILPEDTTWSQMRVSACYSLQCVDPIARSVKVRPSR